MRVASCRVTALGEFTPWGKQFLSQIQNAQMIDVTFSPSFTAFIEATVAPQVQIVVM
jgi:hypothetical protein